MEIKRDDLSGGEVIGLLEEHLADMYATSPPESVHALDVEALKAPEITFYSGWIDGKLAGCVALKRLSELDVELKSMRTVHGFRGQGVASQLLTHVLNQAKAAGYRGISLETGTQDYFAPARNLYQKFGFETCGPFSHYKLDPCSHFMTMGIQQES
ncbi:GNAT family N-acetyltransferase [Rhodanobacter aciditrophus]|uniref:GNAT family N-acetyltransferase n=1 Tax=Rhodanobacter aciditrophus TaxID=1623218 RepID=A0ABW4AXL5_9GAMM